MGIADAHKGNGTSLLVVVEWFGGIKKSLVVHTQINAIGATCGRRQNVVDDTLGQLALIHGGFATGEAGEMFAKPP